MRLFDFSLQCGHTTKSGRNGLFSYLAIQNNLLLACFFVKSSPRYSVVLPEEWQNIQRIMLFLVLKPTTQSIIAGKLSAYARKNKTQHDL